ncbi:MAG: biotin/lipoyl-binding protein [Chloroflexi bacterium]|nr:biotin/lipoyl-binding protein [Chloroflexota bacterium]
MDANRHFSYDMEPFPDEEAADVISIEHLRRLVQLLDQSTVSEVEVKLVEEGTRLVLRKAKAVASSEHNNGYQMVAPPVKGTGVTAPAETRHFVVAPLVGIFHTSAKPRGGAAISVGDQVKVGQVVGTIQSLNVINEVETPVAGRVIEILVQDGQPVEYGQQLVIIDSMEEA